MELNQLPGVVLSGITHDLKQNHSAVLESTPATSWHMPTVWACLDDLDQAIDMGSAAHRTQALTQEVMEQDRLHDQTFTALWHLMTAAEAEALAHSPPRAELARQWAGVRQTLAPDGRWQSKKAHNLEAAEAPRLVQALTEAQRMLLRGCPFGAGSALDLAERFAAAGNALGQSLDARATHIAVDETSPAISGPRMALGTALNELFYLVERSRLSPAAQAAITGPFEQAIERARARHAAASGGNGVATPEAEAPPEA